jgi:2-furoate---CoA ligase
LPAAAMPDGLLKRVDAFRPALFVNHYGSSEIYTFTTEPRAAAKPGSAGKAGLNQRIRVVKIGTDNPGARAATGEEGQIIADRASDEAFEGYRRRPDADVRALHDGWYFTGDTGYFDAVRRRAGAPVLSTSAVRQGRSSPNPIFR